MVGGKIGFLRNQNSPRPVAATRKAASLRASTNLLVALIINPGTFIGTATFLNPPQVYAGMLVLLRSSNSEDRCEQSLQGGAIRV
jgi:hypothetical protein